MAKTIGWAVFFLLLSAGILLLLNVQQAAVTFLERGITVYVPNYVDITCAGKGQQTAEFNIIPNDNVIVCGNVEPSPSENIKIHRIDGFLPRGCDITLDLINTYQSVFYRKCGLTENCTIFTRVIAGDFQPNAGRISALSPQKSFLIDNSTKLFIQAPSSSFWTGGYSSGDVIARVKFERFGLRVASGVGQLGFDLPDCTTTTLVKKGKVIVAGGINGTATEIPNIISPESPLRIVNGFVDTFDNKNVVLLDGKPIWVASTGKYHRLVEGSDGNVYVDRSELLEDSRLGCPPILPNCMGTVAPTAPLKIEVKDVSPEKAATIPSVGDAGLFLAPSPEGKDCTAFTSIGAEGQFIPVGNDKVCKFSCVGGKEVIGECRGITLTCPVDKSYFDPETGQCIALPVKQKPKLACESNLLVDADIAEVKSTACGDGIRGTLCHLGFVEPKQITETRCVRSLSVFGLLLFVGSIIVLIGSIVIVGAYVLRPKRRGK